MSGLSVDIQKRLGRFSLDVAFEGGPGVTVLFGASGAGKSSVLAAIAGALSPDAGHIRLGSQTLFQKSNPSPTVNVPSEQRGIGWVFQDARLFPHLSVEGNLRYGLNRVRGRPSPIGFSEVAAVLGIERLLDRRPLTLSGGEAQRVAIGRALLSQPRLLLMDEPLAFLDDFRKAEILTFIERGRDAFAIPILYVTHSRAEALRLAERLVVLETGKVRLAGPPLETMAAIGLPAV